MGQVLTANRQFAASEEGSSEPVPSLADLIAVAVRPNALTVGGALVAPANFGLDSPLAPPNGWRTAPELDLAAGPAPRDPQVPVYVLTPNPPRSKYTLVPSIDVAEMQLDKVQVVALGPVGYVPGGVAVLGQNGESS